MKLIENFDSLTETQALAYLVPILGLESKKDEKLNNLVCDGVKAFDTIYKGSVTYEKDCIYARLVVNKLKKAVESI